MNEVAELQLSHFRSYRKSDVFFSPKVNLIYGANGAGKTTILEAIYTGCSGRSFKTRQDRSLIHFESDQAKIDVHCRSDINETVFEFFTNRSTGKELRVNQKVVHSLLDHSDRPRFIVFSPDRLGLVKGSPGVRRAHFDQLLAALWPRTRQELDRYKSTLGNRNMLLRRIRDGITSTQSLRSWDEQLALIASSLIASRQKLFAAIAPRITRWAEDLGLQSELVLTYEPVISYEKSSQENIFQTLQGNQQEDIHRGMTSYGPHRDAMSFFLSGKDLRLYGSQGQQRLSLLALLLSERDLICETTRQLPILLLDDVFSELDIQRREKLVLQLTETESQTFITCTDLMTDSLLKQANVHTIFVENGSCSVQSDYSTPSPSIN